MKKQISLVIDSPTDDNPECATGQPPPAPNRAEAERFIAHLTGNANTPVTLQLIFDDKSTKTKSAATISGTVGEHWKTLTQRNGEGYGVFVTINETDLRGRREENIKNIRGLFIDDDNGQVNYVPGHSPFTQAAPPSMTVQSKNGQHNYWLLQPGQDMKQFTGAQSQLAEHFGTDPRIKDLPRVMRLPGLVHRKDPQHPFYVSIVQANEHRYTIDEVLRAYPGHEKPTAPTASQITPQKGQRKNSDRLERARQFAKACAPAREGDGGDAATFSVCCAVVLGFDLDNDAALEALHDWNESCQPPWSDEELLQKIDNARRYGKEEVGGRLRQGVGATGKRAPTFADLCALLRGDDVRAQVCGRAGKLEMDERTGQIHLGRTLFGSDTEVSMVRENIINQCGASFGKDSVMDGLARVASENTFNPLKEYLLGLKWDGVRRLATVQQRVLGVAPENLGSLADTLLRKWFIGAIARALEPGCKMDTVLILIAGQGAGKSTFFSVLGGEFFSDSPINIDDKDALMMMGLLWIIEWPELDSMTRARHQNAVKAFITSRSDAYRPPYARTTVIRPRCSVIVGTTNDRDFLSDPTGNRRFWPVECGAVIDVEYLASVRDQLWAESVSAYQAGEKWYLDGGEAAQLEVTNAAYEREDTWSSSIARYVDGRTEVKVAEILTEVFEFKTGGVKRSDEMRVAACLKQLGWVQGKPRGRKRERVYVSGAISLPLVADSGAPESDDESKEAPVEVPLKKSAA